MAATVIFREHNGAGETKTDKTSGTLRHKNADDATVDINDPLVRPASGQEYSFEKYIRMASSGEFTQISNLRVYTDGANGLGTGVKAWHKLVGSYTQPVVPTESNDPPTGMTDLFGLTSGSPGDLDAINTGPFSAVSPDSEVQEIGDFLVTVVEVEATASQGLTPSETLTFAWDEI